MDAQLKKGILEMCILYSIYKEEMYGYDKQYLDTCINDWNKIKSIVLK